MTPSPSAKGRLDIQARPNQMGHITFLIVDGVAVGEIYGQDAMAKRLARLVVTAWKKAGVRVDTGGMLARRG